MMLIFLATALVLLFIIFGVVWFIPEFKGRLYLWQGKQEEARKILEYLLVQNPARLRLYQKLGEIYFLENRQDKRALRVFEIILKLKVPFAWRDEIYTIVAKYYISEGRKDAEAIKVIEKAVDKEIRKISTSA